MPVLSYQRSDISIHLGIDGEDALLRIESLGLVETEVRFSRATIDRAAAGEIEPLRSELKSSVVSILLRGGAFAPFDGSVILDRVTLEVAVPEWAAIDWEALLPFQGSQLLRVSHVRPRVLQIPISFPIRILETGGKPILEVAIDATFHGSQRDIAVINGAAAVLEDAEAFVKSKKWATVEILHLHELPVSEHTLSTSRTAVPGAAGWFLRFAESHQTRLFIIEPEPADLPQMRLLAQTIVDRGGPAVWLLSQTTLWGLFYSFIFHDRPLDWILLQPGMWGALFAGAGREEALRYSKLASALSDPQVVREIAGRVTLEVIAEKGMPRQEERGRATSFSIEPPRRQVFVKAIGRAAESLRLDQDGANLDFGQVWDPLKAGRLGDTVSKELADEGILVGGLDLKFEEFQREGVSVPLDELAESMKASSAPLSQVNSVEAFEALTGKLSRVEQMMPSLAFEDHESDGMLPVAAKVADVRSVIAQLIQARKPRRKPRHVNASFFSEREGELVRIEQQSARLRRGETVHFGVQIGPKDKLTVTIGPTAFVEEMIRWEEETERAWIEIGVTAIDFELLGAPVQEVGLPRAGETDLVTFALRPRMSTAVPGVARLRFSIFYRNNVIQSFLVAALLDNAEGDLEGAMAKALRLSPEEMKKTAGVGYLARLEYSALQSIDEAAAAPPRALTIISNESAGQKVVTFKGDDLFRVVVDANLTDKVREMRAALDRASATVREEVNPVAPEKPPVKVKEYRFDHGSKPNSGNPDELLDLMWDMAKAGWSLYDMLVPAEAERQRVFKLMRQDKGIHAAHIDVSDVIPWSLIYDREVVDMKHEYTDPRDPNAPVYEVARAVCPASMPAADGTMPPEECGSRKDCLLHPALNEQRKRDGEKIYRCETVICPRRFWGFMVPIEVPVQQVESLKDSPPRSLPTVIKAGKPATCVAGFNPNLDLATRHESELKQILQQSARASLIKPAFPGKEPLRQLLLLEQPDLVYFYCHAHASLTGTGGRTVGPSLDFGLGFKGNLDDVMEPPELAGQAWSRAPLVFMNGCGTVGFSPCAPSEFIKKFIQGRAASAVIGTEVTVWEELAQEVAEVFFEAFLAGETAGEALLQVRRKLLAKSNPLGLVYTLYGSADLHLP